MLEKLLDSVEEKLYKNSKLKKIFSITDEEYKKALDYIKNTILFEFDNIEEYKKEIVKDSEILYGLLSSFTESDID